MMVRPEGRDMAGEWRKLRDAPLLAGVGLACVLFLCWQLVNHYFLMEYLMAQLGMSMLYYHYLSLLVEILLASVIALFASRAIAAKSRIIEELSRQKDGLTDALVHDLRQPLTAVIGGLSSIALEPNLPRQTRELVGIAQLGAEQLLGMVNDLLDISRLEAGKPLFQPKPVGVALFVLGGVAPISQLAAERRQRLVVDLPEGLPDVAGDAERLRRVIMNLVGNAVKFTPDGGEIRVAGRTNEAGDRVLVSIADTGPGIAKQFHQAIFDRFAVLRQDNPTGRSSTGLGLTFSKMIAEAHRGQILVESELGRGSTFTLSLPVVGASSRREPGRVEAG
jgi:signal transduction histidine kinase